MFCQRTLRGTAVVRIPGHRVRLCLCGLHFLLLFRNWVWVLEKCHTHHGGNKSKSFNYHPKFNKWYPCAGMPTGSHLGVWSKAAPTGRVPIGSLSGPGFVGFVLLYRNGTYFIQLLRRLQGCVHCYMVVLYSEWMKLLITMWVTFLIHLVCFGVFHKNMKKLEVVYVVTSLLVPAMIAIVPLTTHTYGLTELGTCWIADGNDSSLSGTVTIEWFALWYGPAMVMLFVASTAMVVMVLKLTHRICWRRMYGQLTGGDRFSEALKQLLPLATFPILFFVFMVPSLVHYIFQATNPSAADNKTQSLATVISFSLWGMSSGVTLIIHICAARFYCMHQEKTPLWYN